MKQDAWFVAYVVTFFTLANMIAKEAFPAVSMGEGALLAGFSGGGGVLGGGCLYYLVQDRSHLVRAVVSIGSAAVILAILSFLHRG